MAIRVRWYLTTASLSPTQRPYSALHTVMGAGATSWGVYAPSRTNPQAALVRVVNDTVPLIQMENAANFDTFAIRLRVAGLWANVTRNALLDQLLAAFGFQYADITETLNAGVIVRLGRAMYPTFSRTIHYTPALAQYATAED